MVGNRLKSIRENLNLNQSQFAESLGLKQGSYSAIENNKANLTDTVILLLKYRFSINDDWLLTGKGEMFLGQTPQTSEFQANNNELEKQQKRLQDLQKQVDLLKKNIQEIDIEYDQEKKRSSDLIHENQKLNRELLTLMRDLIDCKNLVIKLQQK
ncbi:MAG: helix-turn-helix domain-containing protein [Candidatus Cloacimonetes bacterium]|nr:helix-turn-helix domain-containing protein [Candidatus Cloacimonadota bacterium]